MIITVNEELGVVVAESKTKHGLSVCCPTDKFDLSYGIVLAKERMVPRDVGPFNLGDYVGYTTTERHYFVRQSEIHRRYLVGENQDRRTSEIMVALEKMPQEKLTGRPKSEPAATPPVEPSAPAAPSSQSHVTLTSGEYLRLLALAKRAEAARGTEPADTRRPRGK